MINIEVTGFDQWSTDVKNVISAKSTMNHFGKLVRRELRGSRFWPVRTGFSRANFQYRTVKEGVAITNRADYAIYVENRTRAARRTIAGASNRLAIKMERYISRRING